MANKLSECQMAQLMWYQKKGHREKMCRERENGILSKEKKINLIYLLLICWNKKVATTVTTAVLVVFVRVAVSVRGHCA